MKHRRLIHSARFKIEDSINNSKQYGKLNQERTWRRKAKWLTWTTCRSRFCRRRCCFGNHRRGTAAWLAEKRVVLQRERRTKDFKGFNSREWFDLYRVSFMVGNLL